MKELNRFTTESNGETIEVITYESPKGIVVHVNGQSMDVVLNNEVLYSKYDDENYKYIMPQFREFVETHDPSDFQVNKSNIGTTLLILGYEFLTQISLNSLVVPEKLDITDEEVSTLTERINELKALAERFNYSFVISHDGNEYDEFYALTVPFEIFNKENIYAFIEAWNKYDHDACEFIR